MMKRSFRRSRLTRKLLIIDGDDAFTVGGGNVANPHCSGRVVAIPNIKVNNSSVTWVLKFSSPVRGELTEINALGLYRQRAARDDDRSGLYGHTILLLRQSTAWSSRPGFFFRHPFTFLVIEL